MWTTSYPLVRNPRLVNNIYTVYIYIIYNLRVTAVDVKEGVTARVETGKSKKFTKNIHQQKLKMYDSHITLIQLSATASYIRGYFL